MDFGKIIQAALSKLGGLIPSTTYSSSPPAVQAMNDPQSIHNTMNAQTWGATGSGVQPTTQPTTQPTSSPVAQAMQIAGGPTPQATPIALSPDQLKQNISNTWGANTPMLKDLPAFIQAGNALPGNMEKLLPIALALRETQGGKDNVKPGATTGANNYFNIGNGQGWQNYPDVATSLLGNLDKGGQSGGLVGLLSGNKPENAYIYKDFRNSNDYHDLFGHWSPTFDSSGKQVNGPMDGPGGQIANIQWILKHILGQSTQ